MKRISFEWSLKQWIFLITFFFSVIVSLGLHGVGAYMKQQLPHELVAQNWDKDNTTAQISVYFSESEKYTLKESLSATSFRIQSWYQQILTELQNDSITLDEDKNDNARLVVYGYSASGKITLTNNKTTAETKAYGVGGDFFQFHPLKLLHGSYFSESDLMQDRIIIDTETAWKLFGSNDVVGMFVEINAIPHMVVGVYEKESGYFNDAAGNEVSCVYVSHDTLYEYGQYHGLETIEYLIPNPVDGFAMGLVNTQFSGMDVKMVEHQERFGFMALLDVVKQFGTRSMGLDGITFPYWENMARGYEDILAGLLVVEGILTAYAVIVLVGFLWHLWLHRRWRAKDLYEKAKDARYAASVKRYKHRMQKKEMAQKRKGGTKSEEELYFEQLDEE